MSSNSISRLVADADQRRILAAADSARHRRLTIAEVTDGLLRQISGKVWWLERYGDGKRFPKSEIDAKRRQLAELVQARDLIIGKAGGGNAGPNQ